MSYMFELFDIVAGARRGSRAQSTDQRAQHIGINNENSNDGLPMPPTDQENISDDHSSTSSNSDCESEAVIVGNDDTTDEQQQEHEQLDNNNINKNNSINKKPPKLNLESLKKNSNNSISHNLNQSSPRSPRNGGAVLDSPKKTKTFSIHTGDIELDIVIGGPKEKDGADDPELTDKEKDDNDLKIKEPFFQMKYLYETFQYHLFHFAIVALVTFVCCCYITFYVTYGSHYINVPYNEWPLWSKVAWVITGCVNEQILHSMGFAILRSQYGHKHTKCLIPYHVGIALLSAGFEIYSRITRLQGSALYLPKYVLAMGNIMLLSFIFGVKVVKRKMFFIWFWLPFIFMAIFLLIYDYMLLPFYLKKTTTELTRSVIRILVHPAITALCLLVGRFSGNMIKDYEIPPRSILSLTLIPIVFNTFYGRFFGNSMGTLIGVTISSLVLSFTDLFWKCSLRARDSLIVKYLCRCSKNASIIMKHNLPIYAEYQSFDLIFEISSNFVSTFLIITYYLVYAPSDLRLDFQFQVMAIQLAFSLGTELVVSYVSLSYLKLPIIIPWSKRPPGYLFIINYSFLVGLSYTTIRIISLLGGKWIILK